MTAPAEANLLIHYKDFELAQSVKRELMQLRSRPTMPTREDIMLVARKAALTGSSHRADRAGVDKSRTKAWLAIGKLAAAIDGNARFIEENRADVLVNTSLLWARAIDLCQVWMRVSEQLSRELVDLTTTCSDIEVPPTQAFPQAPTLAPILGINEEAYTSATSFVDARTTTVRRALKAIPTGSAITFATDDLGVLCLGGASIVRGTDTYHDIEHLGKACNCSVSLQEKVGTITFYRNETEPVPVGSWCS
jgi:hypothetical protein